MIGASSSDRCSWSMLHVRRDWHKNWRYLPYRKRLWPDEADVLEPGEHDHIGAARYRPSETTAAHPL